MTYFEQIVEALERFKAGECDAYMLAVYIDALIEKRINENK